MKFSCSLRNTLFELTAKLQIKKGVGISQFENISAAYD